MFKRLQIPNIGTKITDSDGVYSLIASHFYKNLNVNYDYITVLDIELSVLDFFAENDFGVIYSELAINDVGEEESIMNIMGDYYEDNKSQKITKFSNNYKDYNRLFLGKAFINPLGERENIEIIIDLIKCSDFWKAHVYFNPEKAEQTHGLIDKICDKYLSVDNTSKVSLLIKDGNSTNFRQLKLKPPEVDIKLNYGPGFEVHHNRILDILNKGGACVIILDSGPGNGKSFYIKHLTSLVDREFIYLPNDYVSALESPDFLALLLKKKNAVIILEDAEKVILSRGPDNNSLVASVLNLSDGILGDLLGITFIITYNNCKNLDIDPAIKRKGRLKYHYTFNKLSIVDAQNKVDSLKIDYNVTEPMTLAEIYNLENDNNMGEMDKKIGF